MRESDPIRIMVRQNVSNEYLIRIARPISDPDDFSEELQVLMAAREEDVVKIQLITPGGLVTTAHLIVKAIRECKATTVAWIGPECASAGTAIALACDEWEVDEMSSFMVHTAAYGSYGKTQEIRAHTEHTTSMLERWIRTTYSGFLMPDEIEKLLDGKDYYFEGEELANRLVKFSQLREEAIAAEIEEYQAQIANLEEKLDILDEKE